VQRSEAIWVTTPPPHSREVKYCDVCRFVCFVCLCVRVCLSASISPELHVQFSPNFVPVAVARFSSGGVATRHILRFYGWRHCTYWPGIGDAAKAYSHSDTPGSSKSVTNTEADPTESSTRPGDGAWYLRLSCCALKWPTSAWQQIDAPRCMSDWRPTKTNI